MLKYFVKTLASIVIIAVAITGCKKSIDKNSTNDDNPFGGTAIVKTLQPSDIHLTSAKCGAELVVTEGHVFAYEIGICWGTEPNPDTSNHHYSTSQWDEQYYHVITDLEPETEYYVRAYAGYNGGYHYGEDVTFSTLSADLPVVETAPATLSGQTTVITGGNVVSEGGTPVTARGVCLGYTPNPTTIYTTDGEGLGEFVSVVEVSMKTKYYIRAYATNESGTAYGEQVTLLTNELEAPVGAIPGMYMTAHGYAWFSQGNLQYEESTDSWRFAEHQWDTIGMANSKYELNYNGWVDLHRGNAPIPCLVSNGGDLNWSSLQKKDWDHILFGRNTQSGLRFAKGQVNGINGLILLPDFWDVSYYAINSPNIDDASFSTNIIDANTWTTMLEPHGAVFLPAAGYAWNGLGNATITGVNESGQYWSSFLNWWVSAEMYRTIFNDALLVTNFSANSSRLYNCRRLITFVPEE